jgi:SAM-dependent methyltransferase
MLGRFARIATGFLQAPGKATWVEDKLAWKLFQLRQRHQDRINLAFDERHGTDTAAEVALTDVGVDHADAQRGNIVYRPLWEKNFHATLQALAPRLGGFEPFTFVDIGSGKGKLLLLAALYPFHKVVGIEYAEGLHDIAVRNVARFNPPGRRCATITPLLGDALAFPLPPGPVVAMIFNAFDRQTTAKAIAHLVSQRPDGAAPVFVVYENVRRTAEIGAALSAPQPWENIARTRQRIVIGNRAAAQLWRSRGSSPAAAAMPAAAAPASSS